jgi:hypothetical protein
MIPGTSIASRDARLRDARLRDARLRDARLRDARLRDALRDGEKPISLNRPVELPRVDVLFFRPIDAMPLCRQGIA